MKTCILKMMGALLIVSLITGCGKKGQSDETVTESPKPLATYSVSTTIAYSAGDDSNWSYGNQRKEFSHEDDCYVRVATTTIADKKKGVDHEILVTYRFIGVQNCSVELSDGIAKKLESSDPNILEYQRSLYPKLEKQAAESVVIFRYSPKSTGSLKLEVIYDDQISAQYDLANTVYFK